MFTARQRLGKQVPVEMKTHATIEELHFLCNGEINLYNSRGIIGKRCFLLEPPRGYITRRIEGVFANGSRRWWRRHSVIVKHNYKLYKSAINPVTNLKPVYNSRRYVTGLYCLWDGHNLKRSNNHTAYENTVLQNERNNEMELRFPH
jgi:hypothetical protein